jgi:thiamine biosynthesis lipoprotein
VWRTVTVAAATCIEANAASTAAMVKGLSAIRWLSSLRLPSRLVDVDGGVRLAGGWRGTGAPGPDDHAVGL